LPVSAVNKVNEGRPHVVDMIKNNEISLVINTVEEKRQAVTDSRSIRTSALAAKVTVYTTIEGARGLHGDAPSFRSRGLFAAGSPCELVKA
jgi:carbamoyl-phosphate synthase large subunit